MKTIYLVWGSPEGIQGYPVHLLGDSLGPQDLVPEALALRPPNVTSIPSSAGSCPQVPQDSANLAPTWSQYVTKHLQNRAQMPPMGAQNEGQTGTGWGQDSEKI